MNNVIKYIQQERGNKTKQNQIIDGIMLAISDQVVKKGDVVVTLGAGNIWQSGEELLAYLNNQDLLTKQHEDRHA